MTSTADGEATGAMSESGSTECLAAAKLCLMQMTVWVDSWQMQCCGEPFHIGSEITWTLGAAELESLEGILGGQQILDAAEDHHGGVPEDTEPTRGIVKGIKAVRCRFAAAPSIGSGTFYPVHGSGVLTDVESADGWIADRDDHRFVGYPVQLEV